MLSFLYLFFIVQIFIFFQKIVVYIYNRHTPRALASGDVLSQYPALQWPLTQRWCCPYLTNSFDGVGIPKTVVVELHFGCLAEGVPALAHHPSNPDSPPQQWGCFELGNALPLASQLQPNSPNALSPKSQLHKQQISSVWQSEGCSHQAPGCGAGPGAGPGAHPVHEAPVVGHVSQSQGVVEPWHTFFRGHAELEGA